MPRVELEEIRIWNYTTEYRFVRPDFDDGHLFAEVTDRGLVANMTLQLDLHAKYCELAHGASCPCPATRINRTDERTMLVLYKT